MSGHVVNLVEVNRVRYVALEPLVLALSDALEAPEPNATPTGSVQLERGRELLAALRGLLAQPLPEHALQSSAGVAAELEAPVHELEQLAAELDELARESDGGDWAAGIARAAEVLRARAARRAATG